MYERLGEEFGFYPDKDRVSLKDIEIFRSSSQPAREQTAWEMRCIGKVVRKPRSQELSGGSWKHPSQPRARAATVMLKRSERQDIFM